MALDDGARVAPVQGIALGNAWVSPIPNLGKGGLAEAPCLGSAVLPKRCGAAHVAKQVKKKKKKQKKEERRTKNEEADEELLGVADLIVYISLTAPIGSQGSMLPSHGWPSLVALKTEDPSTER